VRARSARSLALVAAGGSIGCARAFARRLGSNGVRVLRPPPITAAPSMRGAARRGALDAAAACAGQAVVLIAKLSEVSARSGTRANGCQLSLGLRVQE
jgi:hypothetical protein